jgi:hypothetical protein
MDDAPSNRKFRDFICELVYAKGKLEDVAIDVSEGFDLDSAVGVQLDALGVVMGLPRQGFDDIRYRIFLEIQADLLLSVSREGADWTGTHNNILSICRKFIGSGIPAAITLFNFAPYNFILSVPGISLDELDLLITFICRAIYAAVLGHVLVVLASDSLWDSDTVGPITDGGIWGSASVVVSPSSIWGLVKTIGNQPCG